MKQLRKWYSYLQSYCNNNTNRRGDLYGRQASVSAIRTLQTQSMATRSMLLYIIYSVKGRCIFPANLAKIYTWGLWQNYLHCPTWTWTSLKGCFTSHLNATMDILQCFMYVVAIFKKHTFNNYPICFLGFTTMGSTWFIERCAECGFSLVLNTWEAKLWTLVASRRKRSSPGSNSQLVWIAIHI